MLLVIDTSGPALTTGLFDGGHRLSGETVEIGRGHAERIGQAVRARLAEADAQVRDISRIGVVTGPGSFTGLRAGLAFARGLALGLGCPAVGVPLMQALAHGLGPVTIVLDARRGEIHHQAFAPEAGPLRRSRVEEVSMDGAVLAGSGARLVARRPDTRVLFDHAVPTAEAIAALAWTSDAPARPIYGRGADAKAQHQPLSGQASQAPPRGLPVGP